MSAKPSLLIVSFSRLIADPRVQKQIELLGADYDLTTCGYGPQPDGVSRHVEVPEERVYWKYPRALVMLRQYRRAYRANPAVSWALDALAPRRFDIVLANDVDSAGLAHLLKPALGIHSDLHEYAPLQNSELLRFRLFVAPFLSWQIRTFVTKARSWTTVCESLADKYRSEFGLTPGVVMNAPPREALEPGRVGESIRLVHAGAALANRRLGMLIDAVDQARANVSLDLFLTPNDAGHLAELQARADAVPSVTIHPPVPFHELVQTLNRYDVGVHVLAPTNFNNTYALPNKFFEYVQARLGLIIGPSPEMETLLRRHGLGAVTTDFTAAALADVIRALDPETVSTWKRRSADAAGLLSAETQVPVWKAAIDAIAQLKRR